MSSYFRSRLKGRFVDPEEPKPSPPKPEVQLQPPRPPPPEPENRVDSQVNKLAEDFSRTVQVMAKPKGPTPIPWYDKVQYCPGNLFPLHPIQPQPSTSWGSRSQPQANPNPTPRPRAPRYVYPSAPLPPPVAGRYGYRNQDPAPGYHYQHPHQWTRSWKRKKEPSAQGAKKEPEKFVFCSTDVDLDAVQPDYRTTPLAKIDPQYKAFLISLDESYEKEFGGREEVWDD